MIAAGARDADTALEAFIAKLGEGFTSTLYFVHDGVGDWQQMDSYEVVGLRLHFYEDVKFPGGQLAMPVLAIAFEDGRGGIAWADFKRDWLTVDGEMAFDTERRQFNFDAAGREALANILGLGVAIDTVVSFTLGEDSLTFVDTDGDVAGTSLEAVLGRFNSMDAGGSLRFDGTSYTWAVFNVSDGHGVDVAFSEGLDAEGLKARLGIAEDKALDMAFAGQGGNPVSAPDRRGPRPERHPTRLHRRLVRARRRDGRPLRRRHPSRRIAVTDDQNQCWPDNRHHIANDFYL